MPPNKRRKQRIRDPEGGGATSGATGGNPEPADANPQTSDEGAAAAATTERPITTESRDIVTEGAPANPDGLDDLAVYNRNVELSLEVKKQHKDNFVAVSNVELHPPRVVPPIEVIQDHNNLLQRQIKGVIGLLIDQGVIPETAKESLFKLCEEQELSPEEMKLLTDDPIALSFLLDANLIEPDHVKNSGYKVANLRL